MRLRLYVTGVTTKEKTFAGIERVVMEIVPGCEGIELPGGDILLGLADLGDPSDINLGSTTILYRKLSEIVLEYYPEDDEFAEIAN